MIVHKKHIPIAVWALFPLRGPASAFVGCWGLCGLLWLSSTPKRGVVGVVQPAGNIKNKMYSKKKMYLSIVWALFPLRGPALAFVGCCGPLWAFVDKLYI